LTHQEALIFSGSGARANPKRAFDPKGQKMGTTHSKYRSAHQGRRSRFVVRRAVIESLEIRKLLSTYAVNSLTVGPLIFLDLQ
jgi:hypothetical protein